MNWKKTLNEKVPTGISLLIMSLMICFVIFAIYLMKNLEQQFESMQNERHHQLLDQPNGNSNLYGLNLI